METREQKWGGISLCFLWITCMATSIQDVSNHMDSPWTRGRVEVKGNRNSRCLIELGGFFHVCGASFMNVVFLKRKKGKERKVWKW